MHSFKKMVTVGLLMLGTTLGVQAQAPDKVKMGLFISSSAMPYFIAKERGYFAAENLDVEGIPLATHPPLYLFWLPQASHANGIYLQPHKYPSRSR